MTVDLAGTTRRGSLHLDLCLAVPRGERLALVGANGAGKSSALRVVAGLDDLETGHLTLAGVTVDDPALGVYVAPEHRGVGYVPQDSALFPHLSAAANVAFGPRRHGRSRAAARRVALRWLERVGLVDQAGARPAHLSGGQARRVAIARALAAEPEVLLLDEPLASLDVQARADLRQLLRGDLLGPDRTTIVVTHDPLDALVLADHVAVLDHGRVLQAGTRAEVIGRPRSAFVARLLGLNLLEGVGDGLTLRLPGGATVRTAEPVPSRALAVIRPHAVTLHRHRPEGSPRNVWPVTVDDVEPVGNRVRVTLQGPVPLIAEVTGEAAADLGLRAGESVWASLKATEVDVYPA